MEKMPRWEKLKLLNDSEIEICYKGDVYRGRLEDSSRYIQINYKNGISAWHPNTCEELFDDWQTKHIDAFKSFTNPPSKGSWPETKDPIGFAIEYMKTYGTGIIYDERTQVAPTFTGSLETCVTKIDEIKKK